MHGKSDKKAMPKLPRGNQTNEKRIQLFRNTALPMWEMRCHLHANPEKTCVQRGNKEPCDKNVLFGSQRSWGGESFQHEQGKCL